MHMIVNVTTMVDLAETHFLKLHEDLVANPYPFFRRLRDEAPVYREADYGVILVSRYDDVQDVLRRADVFSNIALVSGPFAPLPPLDDLAGFRETHLSFDKLATNDPPDHTRYRRILNRLFAPRSVAGLEPRLREFADGLIDEFIEDGEVEFLSRFASILPALAVSELLGVPSADLETLREIFGDRARVRESSDDQEEDFRRGRAHSERIWKHLMAYFTDEITARREQGRTDGVMGDLAHACFADGEKVPLDAIVGLIVALFAGGAEANTNEMLTNLAMLLARRPDLQDALRADPAGIDVFVEEALRYETPLLGLFRVALQDTRIRDMSVSKGDIVMVLYASANHDEAEFEAADTFEPQCPHKHAIMSFGHGAHLCPGAHLARLEGRVATAALLDRLRNIRFASGQAERPEYARVALARSPQALRIAFDPAR
jgi:cytochrome P450